MYRATEILTLTCRNALNRLVCDLYSSSTLLLQVKIIWIKLSDLISLRFQWLFVIYRARGLFTIRTHLHLYMFIETLHRIHTVSVVNMENVPDAGTLDTDGRQTNVCQEPVPKSECAKTWHFNDIYSGVNRHIHQVAYERLLMRTRGWFSPNFSIP